MQKNSKFKNNNGQGGWFLQSLRHRDARFKALGKKRDKWVKLKEQRIKKRAELFKKDGITPPKSDEVYERTKRPILGYPGGKTKLAERIVKEMTPHKLYVEPFCGGLSVFFKKPPAEKSVISDKDKNLMEFYKFFRDIDVKKFNELDFTPSKTRLERIKEKKPKSKLGRVYKFLYKFKVGYSGGKGFCNDMRVKTDRKDYYVKHIKKNAEAYQIRLKPIKILAQDYKNIIKQYDSPNTFFYCFAPKTLIRLADESLKPISEIHEGDRIYSVTNSGSIVKKVISREYKGKIYCIKVMGVINPIRVTPEHPLACIQLSKNDYNHTNKQRMWNKILSKDRRVFKKANEIKKGDMALIPTKPVETISNYVFKLNNTTLKHGKAKEISKKIKLQKELMRLLGYYISEGHVGKKKGRAYSTFFSFSTNEKELIDDTKELIKRLFGLETTEYTGHPGVTQVIVSSVHFSEFISSLVCGTATTKRLSDILMVIEPPLQREMLKTWMLGDGGFYRKQSNASKLTGTTSSNTLANQLYSIMLRCGLRPSLKIRNNGNGFKTFDVYLSINEDIKQLTEEQITGRERSRRRFIEGYLISPITSIKEEEYEGLVFNCETDSHTYVANYVVVHNCDPPYYQTNNVSYNFKNVDPSELKNTLKNIKGKFLLSYNNHPLIRNTFKDFNMKKVKTQYSISKDIHGKPQTELLIKNY